jgi:hypothetical protein
MTRTKGTKTTTERTKCVHGHDICYVCSGQAAAWQAAGAAVTATSGKAA